MTLGLLAPALFALAAGSLGGWLRRRLPPRAAVIMLTMIAVAAAAAVVWALILLVVGGLIGVPQIATRLGWCRTVLQAGHSAPPQVAAAAAVCLVIGAVRLLMFEARWRQSIHRHGPDGEVDVLNVDEVVAYSVPGRRGRVVISRGLLRVLSVRERAAVLAHERCHLNRNHHRFLRAAGLSAAVVPILARLAKHVRFATEREADEAAADAVGDRRTVARAIAAAAIGSPVSRPAMALGDHGVVDRVQELLHPQTVAWMTVGAILTGLASAFVVLSSSTLQLHHLVVFAAHVCGLG